MNSRFCPKCGKSETKQNPLINEICRSCFIKQTPLVKNYKELILVICPVCKSYLYKNKWFPQVSKDKKKNFINILQDILPEKLESNQKFKIRKITISSEFNKGIPNSGIIEVPISIEGTINKSKLKESYLFPVKVENSICNLCKKKSSQYFEAIIQIRPKNKELLDFIKRDMSLNKNIAITKFEEKKFGYDLYITSKGYLQEILSKVKKKFNIENTLSRTLYGRKEGKDVYRITLLIRLKQ